MIFSFLCNSKNTQTTDTPNISTSYKREKGRSLLNIPPEYIILDIETTGLNPAFDEIIEIACLKISNGKTISTCHSYIQPEPFFDDDGIKHYVDSFISDLTGITDEQLNNAPKFKDIAKDLFNFLGDALIIGHNVNFDINFLYDNLLKSLDQKLSNDYLDTLRLSRIIYPDLAHHRLKDLCKLFKIDIEQHRALNDCHITQEIIIHVQEEIANRNIDLSSYAQKHNIKLSELTGDVTLNDPTHLFYQKHIVFTGKLNHYIRKDAAQIVCNIGGICEDNVTKKTNFLIVGGLTDIPNIHNGKSNKIKKAENLILNGQDLKILSEETFYDLLEDTL